MLLRSYIGNVACVVTFSKKKRDECIVSTCFHCVLCVCSALGENPRGMSLQLRGDKSLGSAPVTSETSIIVNDSGGEIICPL